MFLLVFISGPYSSDPEGNTRRAMAAALALDMAALGAR